MRIIIKNGRIFDAIDGKVRENGATVISGGSIEKIFPLGEPFTEQSGDKVFDLQEEVDSFIMPGLIDSHLHLAHSGFDKREKIGREALIMTRFVNNGIRELISGVTTVRDCGAAKHIDVAYKKALSLKLLVGPRTYISGQPIIATGGHCTYMGRQVDGPYEAMKGTREQIDKMVDFIKIMVTGGLTTPTGTPTTAQLTIEEISAIVEVAHMNEKKVSVHLEGGPSLIPCVEVGIDILDHGIYMTDEDIECLAKHKVSYVPTLAAIYLIAYEGDKEEVPVDATTMDKAKKAVEIHLKSFEKAAKAGVLISAGTDYKHGILAVELELMSKGGFSNERALLAATRDGAKVMGIDDKVGTLEAGKLADLLILRGNPLENIKDVRKVNMVFLDGQMVVKDGMLLFPDSYISEPIQSIYNDGR